MILTKKRSLFVILSLLCAICFIFAGANMVKADTQPGLTPIQLEATTMNEKASIRLVQGTSGIRFTTNVAESDLAKFANTDDIKVVTMITPARYLTAAGLSFEEFTKDSDVTMKEITVAKANLPAAVDGVITVNSVLLEVKEHNIAEPFVARTYITDGASIGYAEAQARSIYDVATAYIADNNFADEEVEMPILERYTKSTVADAENVETVIANATKGKVIALDAAQTYGTITVPEAAENLIIDGKGATVERISFAVSETAVKNVIVKNVNFAISGTFTDEAQVGGIIVTGAPVIGLTVSNCSFTGDTMILGYKKITNLVVEDCTFNNVGASVTNLTAIKISNFENMTVKNSAFDTVAYSAINVGSGTGAMVNGYLNVTGNNFKNTASRPLRFAGSSEGLIATVSGNYFGSIANTSDKEYVKSSTTGTVSAVFGVNTFETCIVAKAFNGVTVNVNEQVVGDHDWSDGECTICETVCDHDWSEDVTCSICGLIKEALPYEVKYGSLTSDDMYITNNANGTVTVGAEKFTSRSQFVQVFNGEFKANTTYLITISGIFSAEYSSALRVYFSATDYALSETTPVILASESAEIIEFTVGEEDIDQIVLYTTTRYQDGGTDGSGDTPWSITLNGTIKEKVEGSPFMVEIANTMYGADVVYNADGSSTVSAPAFSISYFYLDLIFNGKFKANTTYEINFNTKWTGDTAWKIVAYLDPDETDGKYGTESTTWGKGVYLTQTGTPTRTLKYTVGDTDVDQIVITSWTRYCYPAGQDTTEDIPWSITFSGSITEVRDYYISELDTSFTQSYNADGSVTIQGAEFPVTSTFNQVFRGEFKANTTYKITMTGSNFIGAYPDNYQVRFYVNNSFGPYINTQISTATYEYTVGDTDVDMITILTIMRDNRGQDFEMGAFSITLKSTIKEVKAYQLVAVNTLDDMYFTANSDGSWTIGANAFSGRSTFKQIFNGKFKANTTYVITLTGSNFTGDYAGDLRVYSDASNYATSNTLMNNSNYNPRVIEITIGDADVSSIVLYSTTRYQSGNGDATGTTPWAITLSATIAEKVA